MAQKQTIDINRHLNIDPTSSSSSDKNKHNIVNPQKTSPEDNKQTIADPQKSTQEKSRHLNLDPHISTLSAKNKQIIVDPQKTTPEDSKRTITDPPKSDPDKSRQMNMEPQRSPGRPINIDPQKSPGQSRPVNMYPQRSPGQSRPINIDLQRSPGRTRSTFINPQRSPGQSKLINMDPQKSPGKTRSTHLDLQISPRQTRSINMDSQRSPVKSTQMYINSQRSPRQINMHPQRSPGTSREINMDPQRSTSVKNKQMFTDPWVTNKDNLFRAKKKISFVQRTPTTTVIVNPIIRTTSTSVRPPYPTVVTYGYPSPRPVITRITPYTLQPVLAGYPYPDTNWTSFLSSLSSMGVRSSAYSMPMPPLPVTICSPVISPQICPYTSGVPSPFREPPPPIPLPHSARVSLDSSLQEENRSFDSDQMVPSTPQYVKTFDINRNQSSSKKYSKQEMSDLGSYLTLPRELFPNARMLTLDPNPIINELCYEDNIDKHYPWILDIEFGVPRIPVTRPIAIYDVQFNSVHCKNTPGAIHPCFETCSPDLKRALLFYYDCIMSIWYKGFIEMNQDNNVEHFQNWLQKPMQVFGLCWP